MNREIDPQERIVAALVPWLQRKLPGAGNIGINNFQKPGMGLSNETYLLDLTWEEKGRKMKHEMVFRSAPLDHKVFPDYHLGNQYLIMKGLKNSPVPVPEVFWLEEDDRILGSAFYLMERLNGTMPKDYPSYHGSGAYFDAAPEQRAKMWWGSLEVVAKTNMVDWKKLGFEFLGVPDDGTGPVDRQLAYWRRYFNWIKDDPAESHPVLEKTLEWLEQNRYEPERVCLCWGDARMGNTLYREPGFDVVAALDWEMAFLGDPDADLAWFIFMDWYLATEYNLERLPGSPGAEETIRRYEAITGWRVRHYEYNEIFSAMRFGMILISVLKKMKRQGIPLDDGMLRNNSCTRRLAALLGLETPGQGKDIADVKGGTVSIQFNFTGEGGHDWHILADKGKAVRHEGVIDAPTCTVRAETKDWKALQTGELNQLEAWKTGRLVVTGDLKVMIELKDDISRLSQQGCN